MGNSVTPLQKGFLYQAYYFWIKATGLFEGFSKIQTIGYEINGTKAFDDVQVKYKEPIRGERGEFIEHDFFQLKFHIDSSGSVGFQELTDPAFIGGTKFSFLQRLKDLHDSNPKFAERGRYYLFTNWPPKTDDPLAEIIGGTGGEIRIEKLQGAGGPKSHLGQVRESWKNHLGLKTDDELYKIILGMRIVYAAANLEGLKKDLSSKLNSVGFQPIDPSMATEPYSSLIFRLCHEGKSEFTREQLLEELNREKLVLKALARTASKFLGVRSFFRYAEQMENETQAMVPLEGYFDGRFIKDPVQWGKGIKHDLVGFIDRELPAKSAPADLLLDVHSSIAFAVGAILDPKRSVNVGVVQKGARGTETWRVSKAHELESPKLIIEEQANSTGEATEIAVVINVTRSATADVTKYIKEQLPRVAKTVSLQLAAGLGPTVIQSADHAWKVAEVLSEALRELRSNAGVGPTFHVFTSAPNAVTFFLGRLSGPIGRIQLYEFDFERKRHGTYEPSITLPW